MESKSDIYKYEPIDLDTSAFRLLRLCKGRGSDIKYELLQAFTEGENIILYEALSYTWGDAKVLYPIKVNDGKLYTTKNLYHALYHLRMSDRDGLMLFAYISINPERNPSET
ncbi:hypothetical protein F5884DRAFT_722008 [Xylogone sp. PMI_703]|nr:hypothetical protein F5884DRAFT_722008 [Xylogone sp. PMI_703]